MNFYILEENIDQINTHSLYIFTNSFTLLLFGRLCHQFGHHLIFIFDLVQNILFHVIV